MSKLKLFAVSMFFHGAELHSFDPRRYDYRADPGHIVDIIEAESLEEAKRFAFSKNIHRDRRGYEPSIKAVEIPQDLIDKYATHNRTSLVDP